MRTSARGTCFVNAATPSFVPRSAAIPDTLAEGTSWRIFCNATSTRAAVRPFTRTCAPSCARAAAMAKPIPAVEPVTTASLSFSPRSIGVLTRRCKKRAPLARDGCGGAFDFGNVRGRKNELCGAHNAVGLFGVASANDCAGDRRILENPGNRDFAWTTAVACADFSKAFDELNIFRKLRVAGFRIARTEIVRRKRSGALTGHAAGQKTRCHRRIADGANSLLSAEREGLRFDGTTDDGIRRLIG